MRPVRLEPAALRSRVKHSTTEPLLSHILVGGGEGLYYLVGVHTYKFLSEPQKWLSLTDVVQTSSSLITAKLCKCLQNELV